MTPASAVSYEAKRQKPINRPPRLLQRALHESPHDNR
jgi:hypothetical protein